MFHLIISHNPTEYHTLARYSVSSKSSHSEVPWHMKPQDKVSQFTADVCYRQLAIRSEMMPDKSLGFSCKLRLCNFASCQLAHER
ncbi:hypothetical protein BgiBS90_004324 [Biomphalaria glabrata]|nr:hypothetical protein BgiBS90_004324 [Biomphalaria glabrata]